MRQLVSVIWALALLIVPGGALAQGVTVRSGEHPEFSRLVFAFPYAPDWALERNESGYVLRATPDFRGLDLADIFRLIPRTRLSAVRPGAAEDVLFLEIPCDCRPEAFVLNGNTLVIDIHDAPSRTADDVPDGREPPTSDASVLDAMIRAPLQRLSSLAEDAQPELPLYPAEQPGTSPTPVLPLLPEFGIEDDQAQGLILDLATELSRAAAQGLISADAIRKAPEAPPGDPIPLPDLPNVRIDTAIDRAFTTDADNQTASDHPEVCLSDRLFDVKVLDKCRFRNQIPA